jgi:hypothetical protein
VSVVISITACGRCALSLDEFDLSRKVDARSMTGALLKNKSGNREAFGF